MRYAILSDIHGNLTALNSVLEDINRKNIDRVICLGDTISKGCHSHECLAIIKKVADVVLLGNNDAHFTKGLDEIAQQSSQNFNFDSFYFNQKQLTNEDINYIKSLPMCCEFEISGCLVRCFHAAPYDYDKTIIGYDRLIDKMKQFEPCDYTSAKVADIAIFGHVHDPHMECLFGRRLINVGSVGNPVSFISDDKYNSTAKNLRNMAQYLIIEGKDGKQDAGISISFEMVEYDIDGELESFNFKAEKECYIKELKEGKYRHPERITKKLNTLGVNIR